MRPLMGLVLAGALVLGTASRSDAQVAVSIGNPYTGQGVFVGAPVIGTGFGYPGYGINTYSPYSTGFGYPGYGGNGVGYNNYYSSGYLGRPGGFSYSSGYQGYAPPVGAYGFRGRPYSGYGYGGFGYRPYYGGFRRGYR